MRKLSKLGCSGGPHLSILVHSCICVKESTPEFWRNTELYPSSDAAVHIQLVHCGGLPDRPVLEMRFGGEERWKMAIILEHLENLGTTETRPSQTLEEQILRWGKLLCLSMSQTSLTTLDCLLGQC